VKGLFPRTERATLPTWAILIVLTFFPASTLSQLQVSFSGYALNLPAYQHTNEILAAIARINQDQFSDLTRVRLRPSLFPWDDGNLSVEYEITGLYKTSDFSTVGDLDQGRNQLVGLSWLLIDSDNYLARHYIDRLFFKQIFEAGEVVIGRQRISMGTGRVWNPTDLFNPINPANFAKIEKDGVDALTGRLYLGTLSDLSFVYNPYNDFNEKNIGAKVRSNIEGYDFSLLYGRFDTRDVAGVDFAGNILDAGLRGEVIYSTESERDDRFVSFILGIDNQFSPEIYALLEYHFNGEGKEDRKEYELERLLNGTLLNLGQQYLAATFSYQAHPLVNCTLASISNLLDASGFIMLTGVYSLTDNAALTAGGQITYGGTQSEYWYYPTSLYLQIEYHF